MRKRSREEEAGAGGGGQGGIGETAAPNVKGLFVSHHALSGRRGLYPSF